MKYNQDMARNKTNLRNKAYRYTFVIKQIQKKK